MDLQNDILTISELAKRWNKSKEELIEVFVFGGFINVYCKYEGAVTRSCDTVLEKNPPYPTEYCGSVKPVVDKENINRLLEGKEISMEMFYFENYLFPFYPAKICNNRYTSFDFKIDFNSLFVMLEEIIPFEIGRGLRDNSAENAYNEEFFKSLDKKYSNEEETCDAPFYANQKKSLLKLIAGLFPVPDKEINIEELPNLKTKIANEIKKRGNEIDEEFIQKWIEKIPALRSDLLEEKDSKGGQSDKEKLLTIIICIFELRYNKKIDALERETTGRVLNTLDDAGFPGMNRKTARDWLIEAGIQKQKMIKEHKFEDI